jgi:pyridoxal phosphate enzyme (YggS family)
MPDPAGDVGTRLDAVRARISRAARGAGRDPDAVRVIAVTKGFPGSTVLQALGAGLIDLGENRVQEAAVKIPAVMEDWSGDRAPCWHFVGHLQSNKAGIAAELFDWVHSVHSLKVAAALSRRRRGGPLAVLLQVKTSTEPTKTGFSPQEIVELAPRIAALPDLTVRGLMTVAPLDPDPGVARRAFRSVRVLAERLAASGGPGLEMDHLSMGMSGDFEIAVEEGATMVRLGTALFGPRP